MIFTSNPGIAFKTDLMYEWHYQ